MFIDGTPTKEYHKNGQLKYETTYKEVLPIFAKDYNYIIHKDKLVIRTGLTQCYYDNGQLSWTVNYNEFGYMDNDTFKSFRKDGERITY